MKKFLLILLSVFCFAFSYAQSINYDMLLSVKKAQVTAVKAEIKAIKAQLKIDKNNVSLHKQYVHKTDELNTLLSDVKNITKAKKLHKKLIKMNTEYDKMKIKLLELKAQSEELDNKFRE